MILVIFLNEFYQLYSKNLDGKIPSIPEDLQKEDHFLLNKLKELPNNVRVLINEQSFHEALRIIWHVIAEANRYVDKQAPWSLKKNDFNECQRY